MVWGGVVIKRNEYENTWEKYRPQTVVQINEEEYLGLPVGFQWMNISIIPAIRISGL